MDSLKAHKEQHNRLNDITSGPLVTKARIVRADDHFVPGFLQEMAEQVKDWKGKGGTECYVVHWPEGVFAVACANPNDPVAWERELFNVYVTAFASSVSDLRNTLKSFERQGGRRRGQ